MHTLMLSWEPYIHGFRDELCTVYRELMEGIVVCFAVRAVRCVYVAPLRLLRCVERAKAFWTCVGGSHLAVWWCAAGTGPRVAHARSQNLIKSWCQGPTDRHRPAGNVAWVIKKFKHGQ